MKSGHNYNFVNFRKSRDMPKLQKKCKMGVFESNSQKQG